jgi:hypothetical protein
VFDTDTRACFSLRHDGPVRATAWMERNKGLYTLRPGGIGSLQGDPLVPKSWTPMLVFGVGQVDPTAFAIAAHRVAIAIPTEGVRIWTFELLGGWSQRQFIKRSQVSAIKFINEGAALVGGTTDGVL